MELCCVKHPKQEKKIRENKCVNRERQKDKICEISPIVYSEIMFINMSRQLKETRKY